MARNDQQEDKGDGLRVYEPLVLGHNFVISFSTPTGRSILL